MRYSKLFGKTRKGSKDLASKNATLLIRGGFIDQLMAGAYTFLPLGKRVLFKIENIIREEMDKIGDELLMTNLSPVENWKQSGRFDTVDVLLKAVPANDNSADRHSAEYVINPTNEETVTPLVRDFITSYKDLPLAVYHIQTKFRNEPRAKSGILRGREFRMKDLYSFHTSVEDLKNYYEESKKAYWAVFDRLSLSDKTVIAAASGGDFTEEFSHEFQTKCDAGEDLIFEAPSTKECFNKEVAPAKAPAFEYSSEPLSLEEVAGEGVIGVEALSKQMGIVPEQTTKTLFFQNSKGEMIAAVVRGDREIDEGKLAKVLGVSLADLSLASEELVKKITGTGLGYAGLLNLSGEVQVVVDEACQAMTNFEMGGNKHGVHYKNVNWVRDAMAPVEFYDIKVAKEGDIYPETGEAYNTFKACEVGNIFPLMDKFSKAFDFKVTGEDGSQQTVYMGCYGIGSSRVMGVLAEVFGDENGVAWPEAVAPYRYHIVTIARSEDDESYKQSEALYKKLVQRGDEVLWDDRVDVRPGEKFADADLIGCPIRLVVSPKTIEQDSVELKLRSEGESKLVKLEEV
jgi:prolyl-tRNA synthetase